MDLVIEEKNGEGCDIVALSGRLNGASAPEFKQRIRQIVEGGKSRLILDMAGVSFIDSSGLSALISGLKATREAGGFLRLASLGSQVAAVIKLMMLDRVFDVYADVTAAMP
ncbi:MAG: anti-anti-sigma factor [Spirochaetae bacterium HGW-Spirochaetae-9]|nr:MAG: anti-anti-sigma factor [Spirochaetae bacterium HGW-Spirochaetae-9]